MSDYLFDKEGEPDGDVERFERLLSPLAYRGAAPQLPAARPRRRVALVAIALTAAAAAVVLVAIARPWRPIVPAWAATVSGDGASSDGHAIAGAARLPLGAWIETGGARVRLVVADIGTVELEAHTRARIVATGAARHELALARGTLTAAITAPPRRFVVTTPRAVVTDLGCGFQLSVDEAGRGRLVVTGGQVAIAGGDGKESVVHAGARVDLSERGPGAPYSTAPATPAPTTPTTPTTPIAPTTPPHVAPPHVAPPHVAPPHPTPPHVASSHPTPPRHRAPAHPTPTPTPSHKSQPIAPPAPKTTSTPARKTDTAPKIEHDPLKELERSGE